MERDLSVDEKIPKVRDPIFKIWSIIPRILYVFLYMFGVSSGGIFLVNMSLD